MICCGVPRTLPSGPELSKTRLMMLPIVRGRFDFERERDLEDLILSYDPVVRGDWPTCIVCRAREIPSGGMLSCFQLENGERANRPAAETGVTMRRAA
ncbi:hypothetical protein GCM10007291_13970 [Gemmobacter nanjingensis]|uniref:Uncharacterized protein n=1 Tax=Gemmobacter nanjingensis TaxID=488454 RepID=A0ABQ3FBS2_9RHOB|nr:hypothetical protein GCM10007291_13970 [Gemmobacter nanjingensis]